MAACLAGSIATVRDGHYVANIRPQVPGVSKKLGMAELPAFHHHCLLLGPHASIGHAPRGPATGVRFLNAPTAATGLTVIDLICVPVVRCWMLLRCRLHHHIRRELHNDACGIHAAQRSKPTTIWLL